MSTKLTPYLIFGGQCDEAIAFYKEALDAELFMRMGFDESPEPTPEGMLQPGFEKKVMHAEITIQGLPIMLSDGCDGKSTFDGFSLALQFDTEPEAHKAFDALSSGGSVSMPLTKTFWSPCFGMCKDKFGVSWMIMVPGQPA